MRVTGYIRVSDQKLKSDGERRQDINRQKEKITKFSESMGWGTPDFYSDDGLSAFKDDYHSRPAFCKMLREVRANRIQKIIIEDITRWSRNMEDGIRTIKEATQKAELFSMSEGDVGFISPEMWMKTTFALLMAEWSSKIQSHKVQSGMLKRLEDKRNICKSCGIIHLGRHPKTCECRTCKKGRSKSMRKKLKKMGA